MTKRVKKNSYKTVVMLDVLLRPRVQQLSNATDCSKDAELTKIFLQLNKMHS